MDHHEHPNQFALLGQRRFAPFFWTQFLGAGNDNLFKFAFTVLVTYKVQVSWLSPQLAGLVIGALFILPFLLFSATSGQLTDKYDKTRVIQLVKSLEIAIMLLAAVGFWFTSVPVLLGCVFLMGLHSTLFGPVKFAYLPQHLGERELTGGTGMVEMGTFVAILLGQVAGGLLVAIPDVGPHFVAVACVAVALLGRLSSQFVPPSPSSDPGLKINWNPVSETWRNLKLANQNVAVFRSLLGISWMWFFGAVFLSPVSELSPRKCCTATSRSLRCCWWCSRSASAPARCCARLLSASPGRNRPGAAGCHRHERVRHRPVLSPRAALPVVPEMGIGRLRLGQPCALARDGRPGPAVAVRRAVQRADVRADPAALASRAHRARIIAANNILNALVHDRQLCYRRRVLLAAGFTIPQIFLFTGIANAVVAFYIFMLVPEYLLRFVSWGLSHFVYRFRVSGEENIPTGGAAVLVCNHVSFVDAVLLMAASPRPIAFIMDHRIFRMPVLGWMFRLAKAIPIASQRENAVVYEQAFERARAVLADGELVCIFPEGAITRNGELGEFRGGVMKLLETHPVPVVPMALQNLWGSFFSRAEKGAAMVKPFRRGMFSSVGLVAGAPLAPETVTPEGLRTRVGELLAS